MTEQKTTTRFELRPIMCTNKETNIKQFGHAFDDDDLGDFMLDYHVTAVVREILDAAREACGDYETDSYFERWHGGRYMHGYSHITGGVVEVVEIETFVEATGARVVDPFDIPLNLFDTRDSHQRRNVWLERAKFFSDVLDKIYSGIGPAQRQRIKNAVKAAYDSAGSFGGSSPTINDVFDAYRRERGDAVDSPYSIMSDLVDGGYFVSDSAAVVPFSEFLDGIVVLDLAEVGQDDRTKNMLVVIFLNLFYEHMLRIKKRDFIGSEPRLRFVDTMLLVDEADNIMQYEFDVLKKILLQGREFGVGVLLASQYLSHFKTSHENYLEPLLTWFVHKVPNLSVKDLEGIGLSGVSSDLVDAVKSLQCHECLFKTLGVDGRIIRATPFFELLDRND